MNAAAWSILIVLVTSVLTAIATYLATYQKMRSDLTLQYDVSLRTSRTEAYRALWAVLQPLAKYARPGPVTYQGLTDLSIALRTWYFETGGLFLSEASRDAYFGLQIALEKALERPAGDLSREIDPDHFERLRRTGSILRTVTARDIRTREPSALAEEID